MYNEYSFIRFFLMKKIAPTYQLNICLKIADQKLQLKHIKTRQNSYRKTSVASKRPHLCIKF